MMQTLVGIVRTEEDLEAALERDRRARRRAARRCASAARSSTTRAGTGARFEEHARPSRGGDAGGAGAQGEPRRAHARRLPGHGRGVGQSEPHRRRRSGDEMRGPTRDRPCRDAATSCEPMLAEQVDARTSQSMADDATFRIYRGDQRAGRHGRLNVPSQRGMVVLDAVHCDPGRRRRPTSPCAGTARRASAARAAPRSTASPADVHDAHGQLSAAASRSRSGR